jgi:hypothetical protein
MIRVFLTVLVFVISQHSLASDNGPTVKSMIYLVPVTTISDVELAGQTEGGSTIIRFKWDGQDCVTYVGLRPMKNNNLDVDEYEAMTQYDASTYNCLADGTQGTVEQIMTSSLFILGGNKYQIVTTEDGNQKKLVKLQYP